MNSCIFAHAGDPEPALDSDDVTSLSALRRGWPDCTEQRAPHNLRLPTPHQHYVVHGHQDELSALLRSVGQHAAGNQATLVARLTAFMSGEHRGGGGPGFTVVAELEAAGADAELGVWQASADRLGELQASLVRTLEECEQQHAAHKTAVAAAHAVLQARRVTHNEQRCPLLQLVERSDLRSVIMSAEVWGVLGLWRLRGLCRTLRRRGAQQLALLPRVSTGDV